MVLSSVVPKYCGCESHAMHATVAELGNTRDLDDERFYRSPCRRKSPAFVIKRPAISPPVGYSAGGDLFLCKPCAAFYADLGYRVGAIDVPA